MRALGKGRARIGTRDNPHLLQLCHAQRLESLELNVRVLRIFNEPSRFYAVEWSLGSSAISGMGILGGLSIKRERGRRPPTGRDTQEPGSVPVVAGSAVRCAQVCQFWPDLGAGALTMADARQGAVSCED